MRWYGWSGRARLGKAGDGIVVGSEACDDGNASSGDGCNSDCTAVGAGYTCATAGAPCTNNCGDGVVAVGAEACDNGTNNGAGEGFCLSDCTGIQTCNDGIRNGTEACDDDGADGSYGCNNTCTGIQTQWRCEASECSTEGWWGDNGNLSVGCSNDIDALSVCNCAPGRQDNDNNDTCWAACSEDANYCNGNGTCDDADGSRGCTCTSGSGWSGTTCNVTTCGDGIVDPGEDCDENGETATCDIDCTTVSCGDGLVRRPDHAVRLGAVLRPESLGQLWRVLLLQGRGDPRLKRRQRDTLRLR